MTHLYNRFPIEFVFRSTICIKTATFYKIKTCFLGFGNSKSEDKKEIGLNGIFHCMVILETYNIEIGLISGL